MSENEILYSLLQVLNEIHIADILMTFVWLFSLYFTHRLLGPTLHALDRQYTQYYPWSSKSYTEPKKFASFNSKLEDKPPLSFKKIMSWSITITFLALIVRSFGKNHQLESYESITILLTNYWVIIITVNAVLIFRGWLLSQVDSTPTEETSQPNLAYEFQFLQPIFQRKKVLADILLTSILFVLAMQVFAEFFVLKGFLSSLQTLFDILTKIVLALISMVIGLMGLQFYRSLHPTSSTESQKQTSSVTTPPSVPEEAMEKNKIAGQSKISVESAILLVTIFFTLMLLIGGIYSAVIGGVLLVLYLGFGPLRTQIDNFKTYLTLVGQMPIQPFHHDGKEMTIQHLKPFSSDVLQDSKVLSIANQDLWKWIQEAALTPGPTEESKKPPEKASVTDSKEPSDEAPIENSKAIIEES